MGFAVLMGSHNTDALLSRNAQCPGWKGNFATTSTVGSVRSVLPPQCFTRAIALLSWITTVIMITIVMWILLFCWGETRLAANPASFIWISSSMLLNASGKDCAALIIPHPAACRFCQRDVCMQLMGLSWELWPWGSGQFKSQEYQQSFWVCCLQKINNVFKLAG